MCGLEPKPRLCNQPKTAAVHSELPMVLVRHPSPGRASNPKQPQFTANCRCCWFGTPAPAGQAIKNTSSAQRTAHVFGSEPKPRPGMQLKTQAVHSEPPMFMVRNPSHGPARNKKTPAMHSEAPMFAVWISWQARTRNSISERRADIVCPALPRQANNNTCKPQRTGFGNPPEPLVVDTDMTVLSGQQAAPTFKRRCQWL